MEPRREAADVNANHSDQLDVLPRPNWADLFDDPAGESNWHAGVDVTGGQRHSRGATRCGNCGELTEAETCCQEAVY